MTTKNTPDARLTALFAVRFPADISGLDDEPFNGDREKWLRWALAEEGPELAAINSLCDLEDVTYYGWQDELHAACNEARRDLEDDAKRGRAFREELARYGETAPTPQPCRVCSRIWPHPAVLSNRPLCNLCRGEHEAALIAEARRPLVETLRRLREWDMNYVGADGVHTGADTADGPWARELIRAALAAIPSEDVV